MHEFLYGIAVLSIIGTFVLGWVFVFMLGGVTWVLTLFVFMFIFPCIGRLWEKLMEE